MPRSILENDAVAFNRVSTQGRFLQVNPAFSEFLSQAEEELLKLTVTDATHPEDRDKSLRKIRFYDKNERHRIGHDLRQAHFEAHGEETRIGEALDATVEFIVTLP